MAAVEHYNPNPSPSPSPNPALTLTLTLTRSWPPSSTTTRRPTQPSRHAEPYPEPEPEPPNPHLNPNPKPNPPRTYWRASHTRSTPRSPEPSYSRDAAEIQSRYSRDAAEMRSSRAEVQSCRAADRGCSPRSEIDAADRCRILQYLVWACRRMRRVQMRTPLQVFFGSVFCVYSV